MSWFSVETPKQFFIHILVYVGVVIFALVMFFYVYLPITTNHGESITVPDITGMSLEEAQAFLESRNLAYVVNDSSFSLDHKPSTVLSQYPKPGANVKENRKIYVSLNSTVPPEVRMPKLIDTSLKSAELTLRSFGLQVGSITYKKDLAQNAILGQYLGGSEIKPGTLVRKGSKIDLVVGDGLGETEFEIPQLVDMDFDDAEVLLIGLGLRLGVIMYDDSPEGMRKQGSIIRQIPTAGKDRKIRMGETMDIWVGGKDPAKEYDQQEPVE
jgi:beta-lactam-binding protein with PASTA domain